MDLFREQVARTPEAVAVVDCDSQISYKELDEQSDALAHWLIESKGVKPNDFVAVMLPRRKEFLVAALGIWKAGAAYVPIDPAYPEERRRFMVDDCEAKVVIDEAFVEKVEKVEKVERVEKVEVEGGGGQRNFSYSFSTFSTSTSNLDLAKPEGLAYMIYTSGSTGKSKGVMLGHAGLANYIHATARINGLKRGDRISAHRSFSFDSHIEEFYPTLFVGGTVYIMPEEIRKHPELTAEKFVAVPWTRLSQSRRCGVADSASDADETSASTMVGESALKAFLAKSLPDYMVPTDFVQLDAMPRTPSGKIDRRRLPEPQAAQTEHVCPATERERIVLDRVRTLLGIGELGVTDDLIRL